MTLTEAASKPAGATVPEIVRRRLAPLDAGDERWSWVATAVVTAIAAIVRLVALDRPNHIIFDEVYYAPNAYALTRYGVEWQVPEGGANPVNGAPVLGDGAAYVVHPPLGKWMIALGELVFGYNPIGWRISAAVVGILSVLMITRIARRMFGSTLLGAAAGLLVALDGMQVVLSRTALLDIFLMFFLVAAFGALLLDRESRRRRWLAALEDGVDPERAERTRLGGVRWWRIAAAALLGCAMAVKWSAIWFVLVFAVLVVVWEAGARRSAGVSRPWLNTVRYELPGLVVAGFVMLAVYLATWTGWFATDHGYLRHHLASTGQSEPPVIGALQNLLHYHTEALGFHAGLDSFHPYQSWPWQWLLLAGPITFHWTNEGPCGAVHCTSEVILLGTPALWWAFLPALAALTWLGIARRDWRAAPILLGAAAGIAPWFLFDDRTMFYFYALPSEPFLVLAVVYVLGALMTPSREGRQTLFGFDRRTVGIVVAATFVLLVALNFLYFYPIYTGQSIPHDAWQARMWLGNRWISPNPT